MAAAPRSNEKATKIWLKVSGKPENMVYKRTEAELKLDLILMSQEVTKVK